MIEYITGTAISSDHTMQIRSNPGATNVDMLDYLKSELCHQPDVTITRCRANDIPNEINTLKKLKKFSKEIEVYGTQEKPQLV